MLRFKPRSKFPKFCSFSHKSCFFKILTRGYVLISQREEGRGRERNTDHLSPVCTPTRDPTHNLDKGPDQGSNPQPFGAEDDAPTNEPTARTKVIF